MLRIGYHVSISGGLDQAFGRAREIGCTAMQIFLSNPRGWDLKELGKEEKESFISKINGPEISPVVVHMPYLPNIASPNDAVYGKSVDALDAALRRCGTLGIRHLVTHLGSDLGKGKEAGLARAVKAVAKVKESVGEVALLLENEAGQRNSIGSRLDDLVVLREMMDKEGVGVGFCLDTCHVFEAGYDIRNTEAISEIFDTLGKENIRVIHLNDAKFDRGKGLDRHENIGRGFIGKEGIGTFLNHKAVRGKPLIMETPMMVPGNEFDEMALVKSLIKNTD